MLLLRLKKEMVMKLEEHFFILVFYFFQSLWNAEKGDQVKMCLVMESH